MRTPPTLVRAGLVGLLLVAGTVLSGATPAHAADPGLDLREAGALQARGAGIAVEVVVTCPPGGVFGLSGRATQRRVDGSIVTGYGDRVVACTGTARVARLTLSTASPYAGISRAAPFRAGAAFVTVDTGVCDALGCRTVSSSRAVQVPARLLDAPRVTGSELVAALPGSATLEAGGAGVLVRVPYRCPAGSRGDLEAALEQRTSRAAVTSASATTSLTCDGTQRSAVLALHAVAAAWRTGVAVVGARGSLCRTDGSECRNHYAQRVVAVGQLAESGTKPQTTGGGATVERHRHRGAPG